MVIYSFYYRYIGFYMGWFFIGIVTGGKCTFAIFRAVTRSMARHHTWELTCAGTLESDLSSVHGSSVASALLAQMSYRSVNYLTFADPLILDSRHWNQESAPGSFKVWLKCCVNWIYCNQNEIVLSKAFIRTVNTNLVLVFLPISLNQLDQGQGFSTFSKHYSLKTKKLHTILG